MYSRIAEHIKDRSFFLFGPRGTGKSTWIRKTYPEALYIDLLDPNDYLPLSGNPARFEAMASARKPEDWIVIDEVQKLPILLDSVHRLIERDDRRFVLSGSSARKLKREGVNLLAGRAYINYMFPLTVTELGADFQLDHALRFGMLPEAWTVATPERYLAGYVTTYLKEEVQQEGLTRNLGAFSRFLEAASFSQAQVLNIAEVARECGIERKVVENYFTILEDLLLARRLPVFRKRAARATVAHPKFFFFDAGVFRTIRPSGPLDRPHEIDGPALETLVLAELAALIHYRQLDYRLYYWRTRAGLEVDFVLYGKRGIVAIEVKRSDNVRSNDLRALRAFKSDYPEAVCLLLYCGNTPLREDGIDILPISSTLPNMADWI